MAEVPYVVRRTASSPDLGALSHDPTWQIAESLSIASARPESSDHRPRTTARVLYDSASIYILFVVEDRFVRVVNEGFNVPVYCDSCVEAFLRPPGKGYFNFEMNGGGSLLCSYIRDPRRVDKKFVDSELLSPQLLEQVQIAHSLPGRVDPEITEPIKWELACRIPLSIMESYVGSLGDLGGQTWTANFFKCGDETSQPHWISWRPVGEQLNFHQPGCFGEIYFQP